MHIFVFQITSTKQLVLEILIAQHPSSVISVDKMNQPHIPETADRKIVGDDDPPVTPPGVEKIPLHRSE